MDWEELMNKPQEKQEKQVDLGQEMLDRARQQRRELRKGRVGAAPMSNKIQRYALVLQILVGLGLPLQEYWQLSQQAAPALRQPQQAWLPGVLANLFFLLISGLIFWLDRKGYTAAPLVPSRRTEKRILFLVSAGLTGIVILLWLILG